MAGFPDTIKGAWAFFDIEEGDFISFLHGGHIINLYKVTAKVAYENAEELGPWRPIKKNNKEYYFPFRLYLEQIREINEPLINPILGYLTEDFFTRGGFKKTHFQADHITFYNISQKGVISKNKRKKNINFQGKNFTPKIYIQEREKKKKKYVYQLSEEILQSLIRKKIRQDFISKIIKSLSLENLPGELEILGEKALQKGFVDILIKLLHPKGYNIYIPVEVKRNKANDKDVKQLKEYIYAIGSECKGGILIAKDFSKNKRQSIPNKILTVKYTFTDIQNKEYKTYTYNELLSKLDLKIIE
jgi:hypothetical protein